MSNLTRSRRGGKIKWSDPATNADVIGYVCDIRSHYVIAATTVQRGDREVGRALYVVPFDSIKEQVL